MFPQKDTLPRKGYGLQASGFRIQATGFRIQATGYRRLDSLKPESFSGSSGSCVGRQGARQPSRRALGGGAHKSPEFIALRLPAGDIRWSLPSSRIGQRSSATRAARRCCRQRQSAKLRGLGSSPRATACLRKNRMSLIMIVDMPPHPSYDNRA